MTRNINPLTVNDDINNYVWNLATLDKKYIYMCLYILMQIFNKMFIWIQICKIRWFLFSYYIRFTEHLNSYYISPLKFVLHTFKTFQMVSWKRMVNGKLFILFKITLQTFLKQNLYQIQFISI